MSRKHKSKNALVMEGDCRAVMRRLAPNSVSAIVTDPPYGFQFMGHGWDRNVPGIEFWLGALRVAKPGAHLVAFGGTRTYHRLVCAIEDAGWEIRDCVMWVHGQGFPKSLDVGKALDKAAGAEREVVGMKKTNVGMQGGNFANGGVIGEVAVTAPATAAARQWNGWGTALKPAVEPIVLARKPLVGSVAENVQARGTGALNIDASRIRTSDNLNGGAYSGGTRPTSAMGLEGKAGGTSSMLERGGGRLKPEDFVPPSGRWPANFMLSHTPDCAEAECAPGCPIPVLDAQSGVSKSAGGRIGKKATSTVMNVPAGRYEAGDPGYGDVGGASRFFYCPKVGPEERGEGNGHPTIKPIALMEYLVRLVAPPKGIVLDPFAGSGSTLLAARRLGFPCVGIEQDPEYYDTIVARLEAESEGE